MDITIVGAGIAGLSTALALCHSSKHKHRVTILESAPALAEIGAGVQLTPQAIRAFFSWGMREALLRRGLVPKSMQIRAGRTGQILGRVRLHEMEQEYGAPYLVVHRAVLLAILEERCREVGVQIRTNARVNKWLWDLGSVVLEGGEVVKGDLLVAADGINSAARADMFGNSERVAARPTGWAAYRLMAPMSELVHEGELAGMWSEGTTNIWLEEGTDCMTYLVKDATMLNIVLSHRDDRNTDHFTHRQYCDAVDELMAPFEPSAKRLVEIGKAGNIVNYPVYAVPPLPRWTHTSGRGVLVGDAAHAMAFWLSMGVSLAVEDGEALGEAIDLAFDSKESEMARMSREEKDARLMGALLVFEKARKPRAEEVAAASLHSGEVLHLPAGRGQILRDLRVPHEVWEPERAGHPDGQDFAYGIANKKIRDRYYGFDVKGSIQEIWKQAGK